jgi:hypothetical protein
MPFEQLVDERPRSWRAIGDFSMATEKTNEAARHDASAKRLLDAIGVAELDYFSAADERAIAEALQSWPLLAAISRTIRVARAANENATRLAADSSEGADPMLRVVESASATPPKGEPIADNALRPISEPK